MHKEALKSVQKFIHGEETTFLQAHLFRGSGGAKNRVTEAETGPGGVRGSSGGLVEAETGFGRVRRYSGGLGEAETGSAPFGRVRERSAREAALVLLCCQCAMVARIDSMYAPTGFDSYSFKLWSLANWTGFPCEFLINVN